MTRATKQCRICGREFTASKNDYTVNCPEHRGRPSSGSSRGYQQPPVNRFALGRADGLAGRPRVKTSMGDYHRGYDEGVSERKTVR